jgi:hypothetical protein
MKELIQSLIQSSIQDLQNLICNLEKEVVQELIDYIIDFTLSDQPSHAKKACRHYLQVSLNNGGNLLLISIEMGVPKEKLLDYFKEYQIDEATRLFKHGVTGW